MNLLTIQEVADSMKISESTVRRLIRRGLLTAYRVGDRGQLRVREQELERYIEARRVFVDNSVDNQHDPMEPMDED